jgi:peptide/nickel transport system ATP-binding protein
MTAAAAQPSAGPLLSVRDLRVTYGTRGGAIPAVRGVDLELAVGETLGLAGESGCGKSSLAGALLRLLPRETRVSGQVLLDGEDVLTMKPGRLRAVRWTDMAIVFQGALHTLNPVQRVGRQRSACTRRPCAAPPSLRVSASCSSSSGYRRTGRRTTRISSPVASASAC